MFKLYIMEIGEILKGLVLYPIYKIEVFRLKRDIKRNEDVIIDWAKKVNERSK